MGGSIPKKSRGFFSFSLLFSLILGQERHKFRIILSCPRGLRVDSDVFSLASLVCILTAKFSFFSFPSLLEPNGLRHEHIYPHVLVRMMGRNQVYKKQPPCRQTNSIYLLRQSRKRQGRIARFRKETSNCIQKRDLKDRYHPWPWTSNLVAGYHAGSTTPYSTPQKARWELNTCSTY